MSINSAGIDKLTSVHICTHFKSSNREKSLFFYAKWTDGQIPLFPARENSSRPVRALYPDICIYLIDLIEYTFQLTLRVIQKGHQDRDVRAACFCILIPISSKGYARLFPPRRAPTANPTGRRNRPETARTPRTGHGAALPTSGCTAT